MSILTHAFVYVISVFIKY